MIPSIRRETSFSDLRPVLSIPSSFVDTVHGILAAKSDVVVDLLMLDGSMVTGLRLAKGVTYDISFLQILSSSKPFNQSELWALFLPTKFKSGLWIT